MNTPTTHHNNAQKPRVTPLICVDGKPFKSNMPGLIRRMLEAGKAVKKRDADGNVFVQMLCELPRTRVVSVDGQDRTPALDHTINKLVKTGAGVLKHGPDNKPYLQLKR